MFTLLKVYINNPRRENHLMALILRVVNIFVTFLHKNSHLHVIYLCGGRRASYLYGSVIHEQWVTFP